MPLPIVLMFLLQTEPPSDDAFFCGDATAILERDFDARGKVDVHQGVLTLSEDTLQDKDRDKVITALSRIKGLRQVVILAGEAAARGEIVERTREATESPGAGRPREGIVALALGLLVLLTHFRLYLSTGISDPFLALGRPA